MTSLNTTREGMRPGRVLALVGGTILAVASLGLVLGGGTLLWAHATQRDAAGYYDSPVERFETDAFAIMSANVDLGTDQGEGDWNPIDHVGTIRVRAERADAGPVFVGIARRSDAERYLAGAAYDEVTDLRDHPRYRRSGGLRQPANPGAQTFWVASAGGAGGQTITWDLAAGEWAAVVMNADASPGVSVEARAGLRTGWLLGIGGGLLAGGLIIAAVALALILFAAQGSSAARVAPLTSPPPVAPAGSPGPSAAYPLRFEGHLDPDLSRWRWMVKWLLALPHLMLLALLWIAMAVATVVAGVAILFTGRYPRGLFDFNVGVLRWTWRVTFYAFTLGSDRYPPFSLADDPGYPARLEIAYPASLSRPLVLVKWWLLAVPHYLILGVFGGGLTWWAWEGTAPDGGGGFVLRGGLIGLLVFIAAIVLLFRGRYPQPLFDFVMGLERWSFRVFAYAGLMTDEYPPFRLDTGGDEAGATPPPSSVPSARPGLASG